MTKNKRFGFIYHDGVKVLTDSGKVIPDNIALDLLNELANENEQLRKHIGRNTISKLCVEDVLDCAKYHIFCEDEKQIKVIDWIAKELEVEDE